MNAKQYVAAGAVALASVTGIGMTHAGAFDRQRANQNGSGHCANGPAGPSSQTRIIVRPNVANPVVTGPWDVQAVEQTKNGTLIHLIGAPELKSGVEYVDGVAVAIVIDNRAQCGDVVVPPTEPPTTTTTVPETPPTTVPKVPVPPVVVPEVPVPATHYVEASPTVPNLTHQEVAKVGTLPNTGRDNTLLGVIGGAMVAVGGLAATLTGRRGRKLHTIREGK